LPFEIECSIIPLSKLIALKNMKKAINKILTVITLSVFNTGLVFADGGINLYSPYKPHNPIDTGLGNIEDIVLIGVVLYTIGVALLAYSKTFKKRFLK